MKKTETLENLKQLLLIDSKTHNIKGVKRAGKFVKTILKDLPLEWENIKKPNAADFLIARTKTNSSGKPTVVLSAHLDTVLSSSEIEVLEKEGKVYGTGSQDVKGGVVAITEVLKRLHAENKLENIVVALSSQEELATPDFRDNIKALAQEADYVMVFEPTLNSDPAAHLKKRSVVTSRRGIQIYDLQIESDGGHSGVLYKKEQRKNCILLMAEIVLELEKLADYSKMTTLNSGKIEGGRIFNIIASNANLSFECRFLSNQEFERVDNAIEKIINKYSEDKGFKLTLKRNLFFPAFSESEDNKNFVELCKLAAQELGIELETEERGGGSEVSLFQYYNPKAKTLDGFGIRGDGEHTNHEFVYTESIFSTADYVYNVLTKLLD